MASQPAAVYEYYTPPDLEDNEIFHKFMTPVTSGGLRQSNGRNDDRIIDATRKLSNSYVATFGDVSQMFPNEWKKFIDSDPKTNDAFRSLAATLNGCQESQLVSDEGWDVGMVRKLFNFAQKKETAIAKIDARKEENKNGKVAKRKAVLQKQLFEDPDQGGRDGYWVAPVGASLVFPNKAVFKHNYGGLEISADNSTIKCLLCNVNSRISNTSWNNLRGHFRSGPHLACLAAAHKAAQAVVNVVREEFGDKIDLDVNASGENTMFKTHSEYLSRRKSVAELVDLYVNKKQRTSGETSGTASGQGNASNQSQENADASLNQN